MLRRSLAKTTKQKLMIKNSGVIDNANYIIKHKLTIKKNINDFPRVKEYLYSIFPDVDLSDIPIYVANYNVMNKHGFHICAGCYIPVMNIILVKDRIKMGGNQKCTNKLESLLQQSISATVEVEDIVVHELIHAVSKSLRRSGNRFVFNEEEFVYTNCVDFYRQKGMTNKDIVMKIFMPFFINDVRQDKRQMGKIFDIIRKEVPEVRHKDCDDLVKLINKNLTNISRIVSREIIHEAKSRAHKMIELYERYGRKHICTKKIADTNVYNRSRPLDMDCDL